MLETRLPLVVRLILVTKQISCNIIVCLKNIPFSVIVIRKDLVLILKSTVLFGTDLFEIKSESTATYKRLLFGYDIMTAR